MHYKPPTFNALFPEPRMRIKKHAFNALVCYLGKYCSKLFEKFIVIICKHAESKNNFTKVAVKIGFIIFLWNLISISKQVNHFIVRARETAFLLHINCISGGRLQNAHIMRVKCGIKQSLLMHQNVHIWCRCGSAFYAHNKRWCAPWVSEPEPKSRHAEWQRS